MWKIILLKQIPKGEHPKNSSLPHFKVMQRASPTGYNYNDHQICIYFCKHIPLKSNSLPPTNLCAKYNETGRLEETKIETNFFLLDLLTYLY